MSISDVFQVGAVIVPSLARGFLVTLQVTLLGGILGLLAGLLFGVIQCKQLRVPVVSSIVMLYVAIIRGTPLLIQVLLVYYALPDLFSVSLSPFMAGVIAIASNSAAYVAETVRAGINSLHKGQWEACFVLGYDNRTTLFSIVLPQALRNILPTLTNEITTLLKETAILSMIGLGEITRIGMNLNTRLMEPMVIYGTMALFYLCVTTILSTISYYLEADHS